MAAPPAGQANKRIAVDIHPIGLEELQQIRLPAAVDSSVFNRAVYVARAFNRYEGKPTGCQLVLGCPSMKKKAKSMDGPQEGPSALVGKLLKDCQIEGMLREELSRDGGILIDGHSGEILATKSIFYFEKSDLVCAGHGTRHNYSLDLAASEECVIIVRSQDGYVTVFSSEHLPKQDGNPRCFRLNVEEEQEILICRTPLVRSTRDSTGSEKLVVPEEAAILKELPLPVRVARLVIIVGAGRTGKSSLAGPVTQTQKSLIPSAETTKAVTIDAVAMKDPGGGSLILLDCEGFDCREEHKCSCLPCNQQPFDGQMFLNLVQREVAGINAAEPLHPRSVNDLGLRRHFGRSTEQALDEVKITRVNIAGGIDPLLFHIIWAPGALLAGGIAPLFLFLIIWAPEAFLAGGIALLFHIIGAPGALLGSLAVSQATADKKYWLSRARL